MSSGYSPVKNQQRSLAYEESANESAFEGLAHPFELRVLVFALPIERDSINLVLSALTSLYWTETQKQN